MDCIHPMAQTWAEIDLQALKHNYVYAKQQTNKKVMCVIKADAYGHGAVGCGLYLDVYKRQSIVHVPVGKVSFGVDKLEENLNTLMDAIIKAKPAAAKGTYIKSLVVSTTMGPGVKFNALKF